MYGPCRWRAKDCLCFMRLYFTIWLEVANKLLTLDGQIIIISVQMLYIIIIKHVGHIIKMKYIRICTYFYAHAIVLWGTKRLSAGACQKQHRAFILSKHYRPCYYRNNIHHPRAVSRILARVLVDTSLIFNLHNALC